jgi:Flp pilus assembly protein TadG
VDTVFRSRHDERGVAAVEFALIMVPLLVIVFGIIEYSFYFWSMQGGADAARQAARLSAVGKPADCPTFRSDVRGFLGGVSSSPSTAQITRAYNHDSANGVGPVSVGDTVTVSVTFDGYDLNLPFVPFINDARVVSTAKARVDYVPSTPSACS